MNLNLLISRFFLLAGFFAIQIFFGWIYTHKILKERKSYLLIPLSVIIGIAAYTFFLNLLSYIIPVTKSFYLVLCLLVFLSLIIHIFFPGGIMKGTELGINKRETILVMTGLGSILLVGFFLDMGFVNFYEEFARNFIATIARGNFPVKYPWAPERAAQYHYGPHLVGAAVHGISGFETYWVLDILSFVFTGVTFLLVFGLVKDHTDSTLGAFLSTLFFFFSGWLLWIKLFKGLDHVPLPSTLHLHISDDSIWKYIAAFCVRLSYLPPSGPYQVGELYGFMYQRNHLPSLFGFPIFFSLVYLLLRGPSDGKQRFYNYLPVSITLLLLLSFLALVDESKFGLFLLAVPLYFLMDLLLFKNFDPKLLFFTLLIMSISLILAIIHGGFLSQFVFGGRHEITFSSLGLLGKQGFPFRYGDMNIGSLGWWSLYARDFNIYFLLGFVILYFVFRERIKLGIFLTLVGLIGFIVPQVISLPALTYSARVTHMYVLLFGIVLGILLGHIIKYFASGLMSKITWMVSLFVLMVTSGSTLLLVIRLLETKPVYYRELLELDKKATLWMRGNLPYPGKVLAENPFLIPRLTGLFVPAYISRHSYGPEREEYRKALKNLDLASLRILDIDYIYMTKGWYESLPETAKALLRNPTYFKEIFSISSRQPVVDWRKVYRLYVECQERYQIPGTKVHQK